MALNSKQQMKPYHKNPRRINKKQFEQLKENLAYLGDLSGIVHDLNSNEIIGGNQRSNVFDVSKCDIEIVHQYDYPDEQGTIAHGFIIWKDKRYTYRQVRWTPKQCEQANITANRLGGEWDFDELANWDMSDLLTWGFEEGDFPFDVAPAVEAGTDTEPQIDKAEELRQKWNVETGQMWQLGEHRIICGDCTDKAVVDRVMGGEKADLLLTDPPYGMSLETDTTGRIPTSPLPGKDRGLHAHSKVIGDDKPFDRTSVLLDAKEEFWWGGDYYVDTLPNSGKDGSWIVWDKRKEGALDEMRGNSFELCWSKTKHKRELIRVTWIGVLGHDKKNDGELKFHPTQKSVKLIQCIVSDYSKMDDIVADPFSGSGTTIIACENLSRKCRAVEISPAYVAVAIQRWADHTGQEPVLIDT